MTEGDRTLPLFNDPPVIETVLGVQFSPLSEFSIQHFGLFWSKIRKEYPNCSPQLPLPLVIENFEEKGATKPPATINLIEDLSYLRAWFINKSQTRLIQIQKDRFLYNWRKTVESDTYPQYDNIQPKFKDEWEKFCDFLKEEKIGTPNLMQCEVTYVNHLEIEKGWNTFGEFSKVFSNWSEKFSGDFLNTPETITCNMAFTIPGKKGRLHISICPAIRMSDGKKIFNVELTARGKPNTSDVNAILEWFDIGHEWIVKGFTDLTTDHMHQIWRREI
ncbi:MAG: hypothetical protein CO149_04795 [Nitrospirae bacterium CG_4_9_14_3_um_filter_51_5]|nr:MAG: hypothetical protein CO149_04795 [Nitrospirae bacterium CG_4_9_14_3_um_filter_51_5]